MKTPIALLLCAFISYGHEILPGMNNNVKIIKPDGSQNTIHNEINTALASIKAVGGGKLILLPGNYYLSEGWRAITLENASNIEIEGYGASTVLMTNSFSNLPDAFLYISNSTGISIKNISFAGAELPQGQWGSNSTYHGGLQINGSQRVSVTGCHFSGFYTGAVILQGGTKMANVSNNVFKRVSYRMQGGDYGSVSIENSSEINVNNNLFEDLTHSMVSLYSGKKVIIGSNKASFQTSDYTMGVFGLEGVQDCVISDNIFLNASNEGIVLNGTAAGSVTRNTITGNRIQARFSGVTINLWQGGCSEVTATNNVITGNHISGIVEESGAGTGRVQHALFLNKANGTTITGNVIQYSEVAIEFQDCGSENVVASNSIDGAAGLAIAAYGTMLVSDNFIRNSAGGIAVDFTTNTTVSGNRFANVTANPPIVVSASAQNYVQQWNNSLGENQVIHGKLGIGATSPTAKLDVDPGTVSASNPNLRLRGTVSSVPSGGNNGDVLIYSSGSTRRLYIKVDSAWRYIGLNN